MASALDGVDVQVLRTRFDPDAMTAANIYPDIWAEGIDAFDNYLGSHYAELRRFYRTAAANGEAVLLAIA
jgi:hypothetical protein